jgi:hypothetical protein
MNTAINRQIEHLGELTELLQDEVVEQMIDQRLTARGTACKKAIQTANALSEELRMITRIACNDRRQLELGGCESCEDL